MKIGERVTRETTYLKKSKEKLDVKRQIAHWIPPPQKQKNNPTRILIIIRIFSTFWYISFYYFNNFNKKHQFIIFEQRRVSFKISKVAVNVLVNFIYKDKPHEILYSNFKIQRKKYKGCKHVNTRIIK